MTREFTDQKLRSIDPMQPYRSLCVGTYEHSVVVGGKTRKYIVYIPDGARSATSGIMVFSKNGISAYEAFENSAWRTIADCDNTSEKFIVAFLEPENGTCSPLSDHFIL